jgi:hypothetical protein
MRSLLPISTIAAILAVAGTGARAEQRVSIRTDDE